MSALLAFLLLLPCPAYLKEKDRHSAKAGDLIATGTSLVSDEAEPHSGDHHNLIVYLKVKNVGKRSTCAEVIPKLKATYGLEYHRLFAIIGRRPEEPKVSELLPGEESEGGYLFSVKDGARPLQLILTFSSSRACGVSHRTFWGEEEARLDLTDLSTPKSSSMPTEKAPQAAQPQPEAQAANLAATIGGQSQPVETDKYSALLGNLLIKVAGVEANTVFRKGEDIHTASKDHHFVLVSLKAKNLDSNPNCTDFNVALQVKMNEKPRGPLARSAGGPKTVRVSIGLWGATEKPRILRLLSGAETRGTYVFEVSDKDAPIELTLEPSAASTDTCRYSFEPPLPPIPAQSAHIPLQGLTR